MLTCLTAVKAHLQALCTLTYLGLCTKSTAANPELLSKTTRWCCIPVSELIVDLTAAKIKKNKNKWGDIEALIRIKWACLI